MSRNLVIVDAVHTVVISLLVVFVFLDPIDLGVSPASAVSSKACEISCPCEKADNDNISFDHKEHSKADPCKDDHEADSGHKESYPCQDKFPDNCPKCNCCLGITVAVIPMPLSVSNCSCIATNVIAPVDVPRSDVSAGIFRPPRSLN